jgi:hypothetical protein
MMPVTFAGKASPVSSSVWPMGFSLPKYFYGGFRKHNAELFSQRGFDHLSKAVVEYLKNAESAQREFS